MEKDIMKDLKQVSRFVLTTSAYVDNFMDSLSLLEEEQALLTYFSVNPDSSPEAMNDSENVERMKEIRQKRYDNNMEKLKKITKFKSDLLNKNCNSDLDINHHSSFIILFGARVFLPDLYTEVGRAKLIEFLQYLNCVVEEDYGYDIRYITYSPKFNLVSEHTVLDLPEKSHIKIEAFEFPDTIYEVNGMTYVPTTKKIADKEFGVVEKCSIVIRKEL